MKRYFDANETEKPRILGLSATTINELLQVNNFWEAIAHIERCFDARCMTADVGEFKTDPKIVIWNFGNDLITHNESFTEALQSFDSFIEIIMKDFSSIKKQKTVQSFIKRIKKVLNNIKNMLSKNDSFYYHFDEDEGETFQIIGAYMGHWPASLAFEFYLEEFINVCSFYRKIDQSISELWDRSIVF